MPAWPRCMVRATNRRPSTGRCSRRWRENLKVHGATRARTRLSCVVLGGRLCPRVLCNAVRRRRRRDPELHENPLQRCDCTTVQREFKAVCLSQNHHPPRPPHAHSHAVMSPVPYRSNTVTVGVSCVTPDWNTEKQAARFVCGAEVGALRVRHKRFRCVLVPLVSKLVSKLRSNRPTRQKSVHVCTRAFSLDL